MDEDNSVASGFYLLLIFGTSLFLISDVSLPVELSIMKVFVKRTLIYVFNFVLRGAISWPWSYRSRIENYLWNQWHATCYMSVVFYGPSGCLHQ